MSNEDNAVKELVDNIVGGNNTDAQDQVNALLDQKAKGFVTGYYDSAKQTIFDKDTE